MKRLLIGSLLLATTGLACGSLPEDEGDPSTLVTLNGAVSSTSGSLGSGKVGVALNVDMLVLEGGDHGLSDFEQHLPWVQRWLTMGQSAR